MRKMATIRRISEIISISDADKICVYVVDGWKVVDTIGKFKVNDLVIYCEPDSWIPTELAPFLSKGKEPREFNGVKGEKLRTIRLRKQISQGLLLPLFPYRVVNYEDHTTSLVDGMIDKIATLQNVSNRPGPVWVENITEHGYYLEDEYTMDEVFDIDLSERLGIQLWEASIPACLRGKIKGNFPSFIPKTNELRIQNLTRMFVDWKEKNYNWEVTEKLDGSSMTVYLKDDIFGVCSRNLDLIISEDNTYWRVAIYNQLESKMRSYGKNIALQGELCGPGIQKNKYALTDFDFYLFNVYDIDNGYYLNSVARKELCDIFEIKHVPIIEPLFTITHMSISDILTIAEGKSVLNSKVEREGLVFKCIDDPSLSFKAISNKFLLKHDNDDE